MWRDIGGVGGLGISWSQGMGERAAYGVGRGGIEGGRGMPEIRMCLLADDLNDVMK